MKLFFALIFCSGTTLLFAQSRAPLSIGMSMKADGLFLADITGIPYQEQQSALTEGSPFYNDDWRMGKALLQNGKVSAPFKGKLNLLSGDVHYLTTSGAEFVTSAPVQELLLTDSSTGNATIFVRLPQLKGRNSALWHQLLDSGAAVCYKTYRKKLVEEKQFNSATATRRINTQVSYVVQYKNEYYELKSIKEFPALFPAWKQQLEAYLKTSNDRSLETDQRLVAISRYFNSLHTK